MNRLTKTLAGFGLALGLVALPLTAGAGTADVQTNHRLFTDEAVQRAQYDPMATYMMRDLSPLEEIAGQEHLDWQTIKFLEDNLWDHDILARTVGRADPDIGFTQEDPPLAADWVDPYFSQQTGVEALDLDRFSDAIPWQDTVEPVARTAGDTDEARGGVAALDPNAFSEEILWQDRADLIADFAILDDAENYYPSPDDVPQLHAGELTY